MPRHLAHTTLIVNDQDAALAFFTQALRFEMLEDKALAPGRRWLVVAPTRQGGGALLLVKPGTPEQQALVGRQWGGRVGLFLHTDDFDSDYRHLQAHGVQFKETPRDEAYGRVVVFSDLWGNLWDLIEPKG